MIARLEQERDEWIGCHARLHRDAGDLLAIIHRDGGHYIQQHGMDKAFADAEQRIYDERGALDAVTAERDAMAARLRTTAQVLIDAIGSVGPESADNAARRVAGVVEVIATRHDADSEGLHPWAMERTGDDIAAATRRAIVRAAAEIGRNMK